MSRPSPQELEDWFQEWLKSRTDVLEKMFEKLPQLNLDYSPESLIRLEKWLLEQYPSVEMIFEEKEKSNLDAYITYVGEVFRRNLKGKWGVETDPKDVYYGHAIVTFEKDIPVSPRSEVLVSIDRRKGGLMYKHFMKKKNRMEENGLL